MHSTSFALKDVEHIFNSVYQDIDGYALSRQGKNRLKNNNKALIYGEVTLTALAAILHDLPIQAQHRIFYDLGSGTGKAVVGAALLGSFERVVGIELVEELAATARQLAQRLPPRFPPQARNHRQIVLEFHHGDFRDYNFSDGDVIFIQSTCYDAALMHELAQKLLHQKLGSLIITVSQSLIVPHLRVLKTQKCVMGWGTVSVYIHEKI